MSALQIFNLAGQNLHALSVRILVLCVLFLLTGKACFDQTVHDDPTFPDTHTRRRL